MQKTFPIDEHIPDGQEIKPRWRAAVVDWLVGVHKQHDMVDETLFLAISLMDSFLQVHFPLEMFLKFQDANLISNLQLEIIDRQHLQLVAFSSVIIAAKYIDPRKNHALIDVIAAAKRRFGKQVVTMERHMLTRLQWRLGRPLAIHFLRRNTQAASQVEVSDIQLLNSLLLLHAVVLGRSSQESDNAHSAFTQILPPFAFQASCRCCLPISSVRSCFPIIFYYRRL